MTMRLACETARHKQREPPGYPVYCKREDDSMANAYQTKGGSLRVSTYQPGNLKRVSFSFYVYDQKSKNIAYCMYSADGSQEMDKANNNGKMTVRQVGVGGHPGLANLIKPLDLMHLAKTRWTLSFAANPDSHPNGTATLLSDADAVLLEFPVAASFDLLLKSHGSIIATETAKTSTPTFPKYYTGQPAS